MCLFISASVVCLSVCPLVRLSVGPAVYLFVCLSVCQSVWVFVCQSVSVRSAVCVVAVCVFIGLYLCVGTAQHVFTWLIACRTASFGLWRAPGNVLSTKNQAFAVYTTTCGEFAQKMT